MNSDDKAQPPVIVPREQYDQLMEDQRFLQCLIGAGVDNWSGYDFALDQFQKVGDI